MLHQYRQKKENLHKYIYIYHMRQQIFWTHKEEIPLILRGIENAFDIYPRKPKFTATIQKALNL